MSSRARATQSRRPRANRCPHSGSPCNTSATWRDRLAKPHHFRTRPAACTAAATVLTHDSFDLGSPQSLKSCQATIRKWCSFSIPRKPMEPKVARPLRCVHRLRWAEQPNRTFDRLPRPPSGAIEGRERRCKRYRGVRGSSELQSRWAFCSARRLPRGLSPPRSALS
jgi:hypothetical protein